MTLEVIAITSVLPMIVLVVFGAILLKVVIDLFK